MPKCVKNTSDFLKKPHLANGNYWQEAQILMSPIHVSFAQGIPVSNGPQAHNGHSEPAHGCARVHCGRRGLKDVLLLRVDVHEPLWTVCNVKIDIIN